MAAAHCRPSGPRQDWASWTSVSAYPPPFGRRPRPPGRPPRVRCQTGGMPLDERHREQAASFGAAAAAYERGRPPYPPQAIDWLLPEGAAHVLDLGAGTGKLTRQLRGRGLAVTAVE